MDATFSQIATSERYQLALEAAGIGIWDNDLLADTIYFSGTSYELFGFQQGIDIRLNQLIKRVHPEDRERLELKLKESLDPDKRSPYENEYRIVNPENEDILRWIRTRGKAYFTDAGKPYRFTGTVQDITSEVKTREGQQKLLALVDNSIELMSILENDQTNSYINNAGMEMLGFETMEQVYSTPISKLHTPEDIAFVQSNVLPAVMGEGRWSGIMNVRHLKTGEVFPVYNNTVRISDPFTGNPIAIGAVMRDMRPEMAARKALEESEKNFRTLVMQAPVGICIFKGEELIIDVVNETFLKLANISLEQIAGKPVSEAFPEAKIQGFDRILKSVFETGEPFFGSEVEVVQERMGRKQTLFVDYKYYPLKETSSDVTKIMSVAIDVTDKVLAKRKLQENEEELQKRVAERTSELERKNRELEEFTYVSSHDLQEPIRKIKMFREMIKESDYENLSASSKIKFDKIGQSIERMSTSLKDLLNFARLNKEEKTELVDLNDVIKNVESDLEFLITQQNARVYKDVLPIIPAVPQQMHQLFYNLIANALKFSKDSTPPEVHIYVNKNNLVEVHDLGLSPQKQYVRIEVRDNGIGFKQENAEKIFGMFQRLHSRQEYDGTGIGLALCKKIVDRHHGAIWATSVLGEGATFTFFLPID